jgi:murein L,D-transpeptidase YcbB/YkuD
MVSGWTEIRETPSTQTRPGDAAAVRARLQARVVPELGAVTAGEFQALESLYGIDAHPLWIVGGRATAPLHAAIARLEDAASHGLEPRDYGMPDIGERTRRFAAGGTSPSPDQVAGLDVAISAATLRLFQHLHFGRVDPAAIGLRLQVSTDRHDMVAGLRAALATNRVTELAAELAPQLEQYRQLRGALAEYRALAADVTAPPPPTFTRTLHPGDTAAPSEVHGLVRRLVALGDLPPETLESSAAYDGALIDGIKAFQARHGLERDGVLGPATQAALAVPLSWRARQIELSLERLRWLPDLTNERVIALNIPMFQLWAWDAARPNGKPSFTTRAIVGRALRTETPVFVEELRQVIFRPYWNVPRSILLNEILPLARKDPSYLAKEHMEIVRGQSDEAPVLAVTDEHLALLAQGVLRLRQRPGPDNALGLVKFVFPNNDNVYLHSTPAQELFSRTRRDFSHGCVRVEDPVSLAEWVLSGQPDWTRDRILAAMAGNVSRSVLVERPAQVVLFYVTAAVLTDDRIHFAEDIYRHDPVLDRALVRRAR